MEPDLGPSETVQAICGRVELAEHVLVRTRALYSRSPEEFDEGVLHAFDDAVDALRLILGSIDPALVGASLGPAA